MASRTRDVRIFLCYRRSDGSWHAEWLNRHLSEAEYTDPDGATCRIRVYFDQTAPGVADWKKLHFPSLQASDALILVCTPGIAKDFSKRGRPDWVYEELRWWSRHRRTAPIVVDATGEGERWLPELVSRKWPDVNRIDLIREHAERAAAGGDAAFAERIHRRIVGAIRESERGTLFENLEHLKGLTRRLQLVTVTAWQMLFKYAHGTAGQTVLIHGAAGNVGAAAVQLATQAGLHVVATAGSADLAYVRGLGAEIVVDYKTDRFEESVTGVDAVLDTVSGDTQQRSLRVLKPGGILVSSVAPVSETMQKRYGIRGAYFYADVTTARLLKMTELFEGGQLLTEIGTVLPLAEARIAHEMLGGAPHQRGKIVLSVAA